MKMGAWSPLAFDIVRYVGDAVVVVVADTKGQARDAAEAVEIAYTEIPPSPMPPGRSMPARRKSIPRRRTI